MFNPLQTLITFNETVRFCEEMNSGLKYYYPAREDADHEAVRTEALHAVMNHQPHQSEF